MGRIPGLRGLRRCARDGRRGGGAHTRAAVGDPRGHVHRCRLLQDRGLRALARDPSRICIPGRGVSREPGPFSVAAGSPMGRIPGLRGWRRCARYGRRGGGAHARCCRRSVRPRSPLPTSPRLPAEAARAIPLEFAFPAEASAESRDPSPSRQDRPWEVSRVFAACAAAPGTADGEGGAHARCCRRSARLRSPLPTSPRLPAERCTWCRSAARPGGR